MGESVVIGEVDAAGVEEVVGVLTAAFYDYPVFRYVLDQADPLYENKLRTFVKFFSESRLLMGGPPLLMRLNEQPVAAALVDPPESGPFTADLRRQLNLVREVVGVEAMARMKAYEDMCELMTPKSRPYYLGMIGVLPSLQGKGYARLLLEKIHEMIGGDPSSSGIALNTEKPGNVPIYRRFGYEVVGEADVGPLHTWCMFRPST